MKNFVKKSYRLRWLLCLATGVGTVACAEGPTDKKMPHDPSKPVVASSFYPKTGPIATQVIIDGENFGDDPKNVRVWFNQKQASVISARGNKMLVLAPKLPGDNCVVSVVVGKDSTVCAGGEFKYIIQTMISTLAGGSQASSMPVDGVSKLSTAQFSKRSERSMCIDADDNIFITFDDDGGNSVWLMNEQADQIKSLGKVGVFLDGTIVGYDMKSKNVYRYHANVGNDDYFFYDKTNDYASVSAGNVQWDRKIEGTAMAVWSAIQLIVMNPVDKKFYFRTNQGYCGRFDPDNAKGENLNGGGQLGGDGGSTYGFAFDPKDPNIAYFTVDDRHCIYKWDITTTKAEVWAGRHNTSGYLDGELEIAQFNRPGQIAFDPEGNLFVTDSQNHCIRKITMETGYISTVAGLPMTPGYVNGSSEVAQFRNPRGLVINSEGVIYIGDAENYAIRRLAIE